MSNPDWIKRAWEIHARKVDGRWEMGSIQDRDHLMIALAGEVGELANKIKKRQLGEDIPLAAITEEIADVRIYTQLIADVIISAIDIDTLCNFKLDAVEDRLVKEGK